MPIEIPEDNDLNSFLRSYIDSESWSDFNYAIDMDYDNIAISMLASAGVFDIPDSEVEGFSDKVKIIHKYCVDFAANYTAKQFNKDMKECFKDCHIYESKDDTAFIGHGPELDFLMSKKDMEDQGYKFIQKGLE